MKFSYFYIVAGLLSAFSVSGMNLNERLIDAVCDDDFNNAEYYISKGADGSSVSFFLGKLKSTRMVKFMIKNGANPNAVDPENGFTPLHYAVINGSAEIIEFLIKKKGADVNAKTYDGRTPLYHALEHDYFLHSNGGAEKRLNIVRILCEHGARYEPSQQGVAIDNDFTT